MPASELFDLLKEAQRIALEKHSVPNILQPGVIKELMMAEILGHDLMPQKDSADAKDESGNTYEYLASIRRVNVKTNRGCSFQMDRITPNNLNRVTRNKAFYFGIFKDHLEVDEIWKKFPWFWLSSNGNCKSARTKSLTSIFCLNGLKKMAPWCFHEDF